MPQLTPKNIVKGHTEAFKRERQREMRYYQDCPFVGTELAERIYKAVKKVIPNLIHVSQCGSITCLVTYKKDANMALSILSQMFKLPPHQKTSDLTEYVKTFVINNNL